MSFRLIEKSGFRILQAPALGVAPDPVPEKIVPERGAKGDPGISPSIADIVKEVLPLIPTPYAEPKKDTLDLEEKVDRLARKIATMGFAGGGVSMLERLTDTLLSLPLKSGQTLRYNSTLQKWEDGIAITVSSTAPTSPSVGDLWVDTA